MLEMLREKAAGDVLAAAWTGRAAGDGVQHEREGPVAGAAALLGLGRFDRVIHAGLRLTVPLQLRAISLAVPNSTFPLIAFGDQCRRGAGALPAPVSCKRGLGRTNRGRVCTKGPGSALSGLVYFFMLLFQVSR
jgi:hypothetical protein